MEIKRTVHDKSQIAFGKPVCVGGSIAAWRMGLPCEVQSISPLWSPPT